MADKAAEVAAEEQAEQTFDSADPEQVNKARKRSGRKRRDRLEFVKAAMQHPQGRAWFHDLLVACHVFHTPFMVGQGDATAFRCGEQNVGLRVLADIQAVAADDYLKMVREAKNSG